uniref:Immunoglobulin superfamily member 23 n=1 Tax=Aotus nancymaae TaxID=37293 RepID=A0A2K5CJG0_AOTNA
MRAKPQGLLPRNPVPVWSPPTATTDPVLEKDVAGDSFPLPQLKTFPEAFQGVIQTELNYSVILQWMVIMDPEPVVSWTLNGVPCGIGERLFIRRLSMEQLGTYMCTATNSKEQLVSAPVTISLPTNVQPTEPEPMEPDPTLSLSGSAAISFIVAGILGAGVLIGGLCFTIIQSLRYFHPSPHCTGQHPLSPHEALSWPNKETEMKPTAPSRRVTGTPEEPV